MDEPDGRRTEQSHSETCKRVQKFKDTFENYFLQKRESFDSERRLNITDLMKGGGKAGVITTWSTLGFKVVGSLVGSSHAALAPVKGVCKGATKAGEIVSKMVHMKKATVISEALDEAETGQLEALVEDVGNELARAYDYQISMLKNKFDVEKLAEHAADCILAHVQSGKVKTLDRNAFVAGVVLGRPDFKSDPSLETFLPKTYWKLSEILKKPGLAVQNPLGEIGGKKENLFRFFSSKNKNWNAELYGYRKELLMWNDEEKHYEYTSVSDKLVKDKDNKHIQNYKSNRPYGLLVKDEELCRYTKEDQSTKTFNEYITEMTGWDIEGGAVVAFYRPDSNQPMPYNLCGDFSSSDLSHLQGSRLLLDAFSSRNLRFVNSQIILSDLSRIKFPEANFSGANLSFSCLNGTDLRCCKLVKAKIRYASVSEATLYLELVLPQTDFKGTNIEEANFFSKQLENGTSLLGNVKGANSKCDILDKEHIRMSETDMKSDAAGVEIGTGKYQDVTVTIKRLPVGMQTPQAIKKLHNESDHLARFQMDDVVRFYGICLSPDLLVVTEHMERGTLRDVLASDAELTWTTRMQMALQGCRAVCAIHMYHNEPSLHTALTTESLLVNQDCHVKLTNFSFVRPEDSSLVTCSGDKDKRDWFYLTPERALDPFCVYDEKSEAYVYGIIMWEMASRKIPFKDRELDKEFNDMIKNKGFTLDLPEDCPEDFAKVIRKCTHRDPEERPAFWDIKWRLERGLKKMDKMK